MVTFSDLLSDSDKSQLIDKCIEPGDVFLMTLTEDEGVTPKNKEDNSRNKFFIVLGKDSNDDLIGFVLVNSAINPGLPQVLKDLHYPLSASKYSFLKKNSFVDCSDLKTITKSKFDSMFSGEKDKIESEDLDLIVEALKSSPKAIPKKLKKFGLFN